MSSASPSQPPARRQGSFHPQALLEPLDVPGESNSAPVEPRFTLPAVPSCVPQVRAMLIVAASTLLIAAPIVLMFMPAADPGSADVHAVAAAVPAAISLVTSLAVSSSWLLFPGVRNAHFGQAVCLLLACVALGYMARCALWPRPIIATSRLQAQSRRIHRYLSLVMAHWNRLAAPNDRRAPRLGRRTAIPRHRLPLHVVGRRRPRLTNRPIRRGLL